MPILAIAIVDVVMLTYQVTGWGSLEQAYRDTMPVHTTLLVYVLVQNPYLTTLLCKAVRRKGVATIGCCSDNTVRNVSTTRSYGTA